MLSLSEEKFNFFNGKCGRQPCRCDSVVILSSVDLHTVREIRVMIDPRLVFVAHGGGWRRTRGGVGRCSSSVYLIDFDWSP